MRYHALGCDYDGTLALHGRVDEPTLDGLRRVRESGRRLILVTGRQLPDLQAVFEPLSLFDRVVAENGAVLYHPATRQERVLCEAPPERLRRRLAERGVAPLSSGRVIVATWSPHEGVVLEVIHELGLELQVIFNKGAVMVLPTGVNKATGLAAALDEMALSPHNVVAVGDAENDHALLSLCECGVAVANALAVLKERADWVTAADHGAGVVELTERLVGSDLQELAPRLTRHLLPLGVCEDGGELRLAPYGISVLIAGTSGSGKSTFASGFLERLCDAGYQFCIVDPEGDYRDLENAVVLGDAKHGPTEAEVMEVLARPGQSVVANLVGTALEQRPAFFAGLLPRLQELRARSGRPHWILVDETHHLLPKAQGGAGLVLPQDLHGLMLITVHPDHVSPALLGAVDLIVAIGEEPARTLQTFAEALGQDAPPSAPRRRLEPGEAIGWWRRTGQPSFLFQSIPPRAARRRHLRKYAEGELQPDRSFYFRGPESKLNLRAQNLSAFLQLAEGVDEETWLHHLRQGDYSRWFREGIKDKALAEAARAVEQDAALSADESRRRIRALLEERYTAPA